MRNLLVLLILSIIPHGSFATTMSANLLDSIKPIRSKGVSNQARLTDGSITYDGANADALEGSKIEGLRSYAIWDLKKITPIKSIFIQADNNDNYSILTSMDGHKFQKVWSVPQITDPGLRSRYRNDFDIEARYIKLECTRGDTYKSVSEVQVFSQQLVSPPNIEVSAQLEISDDAIEEGHATSMQILVGIFVLLGLFVIYPRLNKKRGFILALFLVVLSLFSWSKFGRFHGQSGVVQTWDTYHYFMSSKYFSEIGYYDLYRCVAKAQREDGFSQDVDNHMIRDLDDNSVHKGTWSATHEGRCRADFTKERWIEFKKDVRAYKKIFPVGLTIFNSFGDHGFNATPVHGAWLHLVTSFLTVSQTVLIWLAQLDIIAIILTVIALWWGFGPIVAVSAACIIGIGYEWGYHWIGGSLARYTWLAFAASGLALLKKDKPFSGAIALTVSGLLRLFPFVFVGAIGLYAIINWIKNKKLDDYSKRIFLGVFLSLFIGINFAGITLGYSSLLDFANVAKVHSKVFSLNQMGLPVVTRTAEGARAIQLVSPQLSDSNSVWKQVITNYQVKRFPLWLAAVCLSMFLIVYVIIKGYPPWLAASAGGPLLFSLTVLSSYDYVWLILMLPLGAVFHKRIKWLLYFSIFTVVNATYISDIEMQHIINAWILLGIMIMFAKDMYSEVSDTPKLETTSNPSKVTKRDNVEVVEQ
ncbi:MAG: hypothetical protein JXR91_12990 [Deltaproteobacteria bacterium]|nr:hypothetical protein [Deltaproteobacteria bacterium]